MAQSPMHKLHGHEQRRWSVAFYRIPQGMRRWFWQPSMCWGGRYRESGRLARGWR